jgi:hypothetical protein
MSEAGSIDPHHWDLIGRAVQTLTPAPFTTGVPFVPRFRCYCLTADDRIAWGILIDAKNLEAAIEAGRRACQEHRGTLSSRVQIWRGTEKLYTSPSSENSR